MSVSYLTSQALSKRTTQSSAPLEPAAVQQQQLCVQQFGELCWCFSNCEKWNSQMGSLPHHSCLMLSMHLMMTSQITLSWWQITLSHKCSALLFSSLAWVKGVSPEWQYAVADTLREESHPVSPVTTTFMTQLPTNKISQHAGKNLFVGKIGLSTSNYYFYFFIIHAFHLVW